MHGRLWLPLSLAFALGLAATAQAQTYLFVAPALPTPADRPTFTLSYRSTTCNPDFAPVPTVSGDQIIFHGTFRTSPPTAECQASFIDTWQLDPLPAGHYHARVEVSGVDVATLDFAVEAPPQAPPPPLVITPASLTTLTPIHLILSGVATSACPPRFNPPVLQGEILLVAGATPLFPVTPDCMGPWTQEIVANPLLVGTYLAQVTLDSQPYAQQPITVTPGFR